MRTEQVNEMIADITRQLFTETVVRWSLEGVFIFKRNLDICRYFCFISNRLGYV
mgnify:CR=1 FL=1